MFFPTHKLLLGCRHLLSDKRNGVKVVEIQSHCAMIVCMLILIYTGEKPNRAIEQMVWYELSEGLPVPSSERPAKGRGRRITSLFLPPYSPELNPVERLWHWRREHPWSHRTLRRKDIRFICRTRWITPEDRV